MHTAPKSDLVLSFIKPKSLEHSSFHHGQVASYSLDSAVQRVVAAMDREDVPVTAHDVFDRITVDWFSWFYENGERPDAVQPTLARVEDALKRANFNHMMPIGLQPMSITE